jgi:hypothetical protein
LYQEDEADNLFKESKEIEIEKAKVILELCWQFFASYTRGFYGLSYVDVEFDITREVIWNFLLRK